MFVLSACGGTHGPAPSWATAIEDALVTDCPNGGVVLQQGLDANLNGVLDDAEVSESHTVCNGEDGDSCSVSDTSAGADLACPDGTTASITDGSNSQIIQTVYCGGSLQGTDLWFSYQAVALTSGDLFAGASLYGPLTQTSGTSFYAASQVGAATAAVVMTDDYAGTANGGWWQIEVDRTTLITVIEYNDSDAPGGQDTWTMTADKCTLNNY
jgi:hypothetical protein